MPTDIGGRAERELSHKCGLLAGFVGQIPATIVVHDRSGTIRYMNEQARIVASEDLEGISLDEFQDIIELRDPGGHRVPAEDWPIAHALEGETVLVTGMIMSKSGSWNVDINLNASPLRDEVGQIVGAVTVAWDAAERWQTEASLGSSEMRLTEAQRVSGLGFYEWDASTDEVLLSDEVYRILGLSPEGFEGTHRAFLDLVNLNEPSSVDERAPDVATSVAPFGVHHRITLPSGEERWIREQREVTRDEEGGVVRQIGLLEAVDGVPDCIDAEDLQIFQEPAGTLALNQSRLDQATRRHARELEERVAERTADMEDFVNSVSHDLRAPLRGIHGFAHILLEECSGQFEDDGREYVEQILNSAERMSALISDLLEYNRLGHSPLVAVNISLDEAVKAALDQLRAEIRARKASIVIDEPLLRVQASFAPLVQILVNLLSNAVKFVAPGVTPRVRLWSGLEGTAVRICVEDNGIGIAPEHRERIFRAFERLHVAERYPGTGIGLAIARKTARRLGGNLDYESEPGKGSRFWLHLKAAPDES